MCVCVCALVSVPGDWWTQSDDSPDEECNTGCELEPS